MNHAMSPTLKYGVLISVLFAAIGQSAEAGKLTKQFLDGTVWEGKFNIEARQSYTAPTTITFTLSLK